MEKRSELGHGSCARAGAACRAREHKDATLQPPCKRLGGKILLLRSAASLAEARPDDGRGRGHWRGRDEGADRPGAMAAAVERRRKARRRPAAKLAIVSFIVTIIVAVAAAAADGRAGARLVGSRKGGELARWGKCAGGGKLLATTDRTRRYFFFFPPGVAISRESQQERVALVARGPFRWSRLPLPSSLRPR